jgi:hypothetical protein
MGWLIALAIMAFLLGVPWIGADSRDGDDWKPFRWPRRLPPPPMAPWSGPTDAVVARTGRRWGRRYSRGTEEPDVCAPMGHPGTAVPPRDGRARRH